MDNVATTNLSILPQFCFGIRKTDTTGGVTTVRLNYEPECWLGGIIKMTGPVTNSSQDIIVTMEYGVTVLSTNASRSIQIRAGYSLNSMSRVSYREVSEQRRDQEGLKIYRDGILKQTVPFQSIDDDSFFASGIVKNEAGLPLSGQEVLIEWETSVFDMRKLSSKSTHYNDTVLTDTNGYFEKRITGTTGAKLTINQPGYVKMYYPLESNMFPITVQLKPIPPASTNLGRGVTRGMADNEITINSLSNCRAVGLSLDVIDKTNSVNVKGWTTNRDEADLWFEMGGAAGEFQAHYERYIATNSMPIDWNEWPLVITGLRGTQIKEGPDKPLDGLALDMKWTMCEADEDGYATELTGLMRLEDMSDYDWSGKHVFSKNFYICKGSRYGRLIGLVFDPRGTGKLNPPQNGNEFMGIRMKIKFEALNVQTNNLGHRVLQRLQ